MQVKPSGHLDAVHRTAAKQTAPVAPEMTDSLSLDRSEALRSVLGGLPEVREAEVARVKSLVGQVTYPPMETVEKIANLLAIHASHAGKS